MNGASLKITKGSVLVYRIFDVAQEINLAEAEKVLTAGPISRFKLPKDRNNAIILKEAPLCLTLNKDPITLNNKEFKAEVQAKLWNYGVLSICIQVNIPTEYTYRELVELGSYLENAKEIQDLSMAYSQQIVNQLGQAIKGPNIWKTFEDYSTYVIEEFEGTDDPTEVLKKVSVARLILAESKVTLADSFKKEFTKSYLQYSTKDLVIIDWNSAVILDFTKEKYYQEYADMIEFGLTQLLEFRYYDEILDKRLSELMDQVQEIQDISATNTKNIKKVLVAARKLYVDFAEVFERIDNSLKMVGDQFYATIFRAAGRKFRFDEWKNSTSTKMERLINVTDLLENEIVSRKDDSNTKLSHKYEIVIILLITIEVIPFLWTGIPNVINLIKALFQ